MLTVNINNFQKLENFEGFSTPKILLLREISQDMQKFKKMHV